MSRERRSCPRYAVDIPVTVLVENGPAAEPFAANALTLSRSSIEVRCSDEPLAALLRQQALPHTCTLRFELSWHRHEFNLPAQLVTHRRLSQHQYVLVLLFRHDDKAEELLLDQLLDQLQEQQQHTRRN
jgi:hypothetical protein